MTPDRAAAAIFKKTAMFEPLEHRTLLAWNAAGHLIAQDTAAANYPGITGKGVAVAILDTGVDYTDPALGGGFGPGHKVVAGYDFVDNDTDPMDTFGHGTNIAGIIAANSFTINGEQYQGIAPDANLVALRVSKGGDTVTNATIDRALQWVIANYKTYNIGVVNFSFGSSTIYDADHIEPTVSDDFKKIRDLGIVICSPSGNDGTSQGAGIEWPAADPSVVGVGSISLADQISSFTNRGKLLDLLAPGESVGTTNIGGSFTQVTLTSFASPVVAGAAALLKQADPTLKVDDELSILRASGARKDDSSFGTLETYSRIDLNNAITMTLQRAPNAKSDVGVNGVASDLAYDRDGVLHFAYYDPTIHSIKYATRSTSGLWSATKLVDTSGDDVGATLSLALDPTGKPAIAYYDATLGDLEYARFDGKAWKRSTVDSKNIVGQFPSLAFDKSGNPVVSYYRKTSGDLRVMRFSGSQWVRFDVDTADNVGAFDSLSISDNGTIGVAYADATSGDLKYAQFNGSTWDATTVDDLRGTAFISLAFNNANVPAISYYDAYPADLKYATRSTGSWVAATVTSKGAVGLFTNLYFDSGNNANIVYYNRKSNGVFRVFGSPGSWGAETLHLDGGQNTTAAEKLDGAGATCAFWYPIKNKLWTADI